MERSNSWGAKALVIGILTFAGILMLMADRATDPPWVPSPYDDDMDLLELHALNDAFELHIKNLFAVWTRETEQHRDADKAIAGANKLRAAYTAVRAAIEKRQAARQQQR